MKYNVMKKWVKALRSGKYQQTTGTLKNEDGYCCLGVLCDIKAKESKKSFNKYVGFVGGTLPIKTMIWSGIKDCLGRYNGGNLARLNDKKRWSFKKIADFIEKNYKKL